ncbi:MAG: site-2 protease family protein [Polyangia bacterium]
MRWAWKIGSLFGIPVRLHVSMLIFPVIAFSWVDGTGPLGFVIAAALTVLLFGSILAHEFGHALVARRFGVHTQDIILTPIGGMARLTSMPRNPRQEISVAIAGPLVSLSLAGISFGLSAALLMLPAISPVVLQGLGALLWINLMLGLFNLIPALPMDGGRILRGYLAINRDHLSATRIAARVGRVIAIAGGVIGALYFRSLGLVAIAVFVYFSAGMEERMAEIQEARRRAAAGYGGGASDPFSGHGPRVHTWSWRSGGGEQPPPGWRGRPVDEHEEPFRRRRHSVDPLEDRLHHERDEDEPLVIRGGRAEVIRRRDPEED